jgi:Domain of unknown function (DUF1840)
MLFRFKSKATADLIMLEADARRLLRIMTGAEATRGILRGETLELALRRLQTAVQEDEALRRRLQERVRSGQASEQEIDEDRQQQVQVRLAQRAQPMITLMERSLAQAADLVWGV